MRSFRSVVAVAGVFGFVGVVASSSGCTALLGNFTTETGSVDAAPADVTVPIDSAATCDADKILCDGQCVLVDRLNCGKCGTICDLKTQACDPIGRECVSILMDAGPDGSCGTFESCNGGCVNEQFDPMNCGGCGNVCDAGVCTNGHCVTMMPPVDSGVDAGMVTPIDAGFDAGMTAIDAGIDSGVVVDSGCGDITSDALNCGKCGHSCGGGVCQASKCYPFVLQNYSTTPSIRAVAVAVDANHFFFATEPGDTTGYIAECPLTGCTSTITKLDTGLSHANAVSVSGGQAFWTAGGSNQVGFIGPTLFRTCAVSAAAGCTAAFTTLQTSPLNSYSYENAASVGGAGYASNDNILYSQTLNTPGGAAYMNIIDAMGVGGSKLVFIARSEGIYSVPLPLTASPTLTMVFGNPTGDTLSHVWVASNGNSYFTAESTVPSGSLRWASASGVSGLAQNLTYPSYITGDATNVYWYETSGGGTISYCPISTGFGSQCTPTVLTTNAGNVTSITSDGTFVYYTTGNVLKIAIP